MTSDAQRAVRQLTDAGFTPSEALDVVRGARALPGSLAEELPVALDYLAAAHAESAGLYARAAESVRGAGRPVALRRAA